MPLVKLTWARLGGSCDGLAGVVGCGVVTGVAESAEAGALSWLTDGDCAHSDAEMMRPVAAANLIGVETRMLVRRDFSK